MMTPKIISKHIEPVGLDINPDPLGLLKIIDDTFDNIPDPDIDINGPIPIEELDRVIELVENIREMHE